MFVLRALMVAIFSSFGPFTLGVATFVVMVIYVPGVVRVIQRWAQNIENSVDYDGLPDRAGVVANMVIDDNSITMLVFVVGAKFFVSLVTELLWSKSARAKKPVSPK